jgi:hypothetical protein
MLCSITYTVLNAQIFDPFLPTSTGGGGGYAAWDEPVSQLQQPVSQLQVQPPLPPVPSAGTCSLQLHNKQLHSRYFYMPVICTVTACCADIVFTNSGANQSHNTQFTLKLVTAH